MKSLMLRPYAHQVSGARLFIMGHRGPDGGGAVMINIIIVRPDDGLFILIGLK